MKTLIDKINYLIGSINEMEIKPAGISDLKNQPTKENAARVIASLDEMKIKPAGISALRMEVSK